MINIIKHITDKLSAPSVKYGLDPEKILIEKTKEEKFGDYSTNAAFLISKSLNKPPRQTAELILEQLSIPDEFISKVEVAGAGFINFFISDNYYYEVLKYILEQKDNYGRVIRDKKLTANIEWVSANPTGPLHAGHGRNIALGKSIVKILEWNGYEITREFYYNDAGKQMDNLTESVTARYKQIYNPDYPFPDEGYAGEYIKEIAKSISDKYGDELINSDDKTFFKEKAEEWCFSSIKNTLKRMGITHEIFYNETSLFETGKVDEILSEFERRGFSYKKDGAVWLKLSEMLTDKKDAQDKVIVKSSGEPTYRLPDMAYHIDKIKRNYNLIIDIFGSDHADTYKEVLAGVKSLGYDISGVKVIIYQMVTFVQDGKPVKMSKRSDNVYYLDDLLDDVGTDVSQFFFVMRSSNTHLDFDIKLAKEQSEKNPVFYLQYAHARISSILRNAENIFPDYKSSPHPDSFSLLRVNEEIQLCKSLSGFPDNVVQLAESFEPHKMITYLNDVAEKYHKFYHNCRVINTEDKEISYARLKLCEAVRTVLRSGFEIIGISAPDRM